MLSEVEQKRNPDSIGAKSRSESGEEESNRSKQKSRIIWWIFAILLILILGVLAWFWWQFYFDKSLEPTPIVILPKTEEEAETEEPATTGCETGWTTYTEEAIGYTLCYPSDWLLKETDQVSETIGEPVKFITIDTPDENYFLLFGLKRPTDTFRTNDRTGVGTGELVPKSERAFELLGVTVTPEALVYEGKIREYFYNQPEGTTSICNCEFTAFFTPSASHPDYDAADMTDLGYVITAEKILKSVEWTS